MESDTPEEGKCREAHGRKQRFGKLRQRDFLAHLAFTSNIGAAAEAADVTLATVYKERQKNAGFCEQWTEAQRESYGFLEAALIRRALDSVLGTAPDDAEKVSFKEAVTLLLPYLRESGRGSRERPAETIDSEAAAERFDALLRRYKVAGIDQGSPE